MHLWHTIVWLGGLIGRYEHKEIKAMERKVKVPMEHFNIGEFNKGQASKIVRSISDNDTSAFVLKNGKPVAVILSYKRYERLLAAGIDINEY